jgi:hypothetical protein
MTPRFLRAIPRWGLRCAHNSLNGLGHLQIQVSPDRDAFSRGQPEVQTGSASRSPGRQAPEKMAIAQYIDGVRHVKGRTCKLSFFESDWVIELGIFGVPLLTFPALRL